MPNAKPVGKHTPTPKLKAVLVRKDKDGFEAYDAQILDEQGNYIATAIKALNGETVLPIVTAVNQHEQLLEQVRRLREAVIDAIGVAQSCIDTDTSFTSMKHFKASLEQVLRETEAGK